MSRNTKLPFTVSKTDNFFDRLGDFVGDVFYDILPEQGYELRDEQIYMAFQLEQAFRNKDTIFAEAGVGTGKTLVYLLYALSYARYKGKPAIISCADETLIEQLVKKGGDIEKLEKALDLKVDVRLAKARENYVCMKKLDPLSELTEDEDILDVFDSLPEFVIDPASLSKDAKRYGDRKEYPWVPDEKWEMIAWDQLQHCATCDWRNRSAQTLNRDYYRNAGDLIICSHDFYMEHVWTEDSRKREGQLPLLPEASAVIFDEGHLLEFSAQKGLTYRFNFENLSSILTGYMGQDVREQSLYLVEDIITLNDDWFKYMSGIATKSQGSNRQEIPRTTEMVAMAEKLHAMVNQLLEELVFDSELFTIDEYHTKIIEEYLEYFAYGLSILLKDNQGIYWLEETDTATSLVIMPRLVEDVLRQEVFSQDMPFVFSSATLSQNGDFSYLAKSLGIEKYESFSVESPFDYEENMKFYAHVDKTAEEKSQMIVDKIKENNGATLVLFSTEEEMQQFRKTMDQTSLDMPVLFEGDQEISETVRKFQLNPAAVLCAHHLWEGLDIPGESLTQVLIASLPFPPNDPVFKAKRSNAADPEREVDAAYMLLRMRQGIGRLIRTSNDNGVVHLWITENEKEKYQQDMEKLTPVKISWG